jgi:hypothetical protein
MTALLDEINKEMATLDAPQDTGGGGINMLKQMNIGIAHMLGLPGTAANALRMMMGYDEPSIIPSGEDIQRGMSKVPGMAYAPGTAPDSLADRVYQNIGASLIPVAGFAGVTGKLAAPLMTELASSVGGAMGGKALQATEWGAESPMAARAIGELAGGLVGGGIGSGIQGVGSLTPSGIAQGAMRLSPIRAAHRAASAPFRGQWARKRAAGMLGEKLETSPENILSSLDASKKGAQRSLLTPAQRADDVGIARMQRTIEAEEPTARRAGQMQRAEQTARLQRKTAPFPQGLGTVRTLLDQRLQKIASDTQGALRKINAVEQPEVYNRLVHQKLSEAYGAARTAETDVWKALPESGDVPPPKLVQSYIDEYRNITKGGDIKEIDPFVLGKLGRPGAEGLEGGQFLNATKQTATPKELHQFYSRMGRRVRELSEQAGQTNRIRILNKLRRVVLDDLDATAAGQPYRDAIKFSRDLNEKFTSGAMGSALGFQRGLPTSENMILDDLLGKGGQIAKENVDQALKTVPGARKDIENFIRTRFATATVDTNNNRVNSVTGQKFMQNQRQLLDAFPNLRKEFEGAIKNQTSVDEMVGVKHVAGLSPFVKEQSAASVFLGADPGEELKALLSRGHSGGKTQSYFKSMKEQLAKDPTGKALKGMKNAIANHFLEGAMRPLPGGEEVGKYTSGMKFLKEFDQLEKPLRTSGLMTPRELGRLRRIGQEFNRISREQTAKPTGALITDAPGRLLSFFAQGIGASAGAQLGGGTLGGGIRMANVGASEMNRLMRSITTDEARLLLIRATQDETVMRDLLQETIRLNQQQQQSLFRRVLSTARNIAGSARRGAGRMAAEAVPDVPVSAIAPATVSGVRATEEGAENQQLLNEIRRELQGL